MSCLGICFAAASLFLPVDECHFCCFWRYCCSEGEFGRSWVNLFATITKVACSSVDCYFRSRKQATQRDLYYRLLHPPIFSNTRVRIPAAELSTALQ